MRKAIAAGFVVALIFTVLGMRYSASRSTDARLRALQLEPATSPENTGIILGISAQDYREYAGLMTSRAQRDALPQLIKFLPPKDGTMVRLANPIVAWVGAKEDARFLSTLRRLNASSSEARVDPLTLNIAKLRVENRHLKGVSKATAIAGGLGFSLAEIETMSREVVRDDGEFNWGANLANPKIQMVNAFADIIYWMEKRKEPGASGLAAKFKWDGWNAAKLNGARLPRKQEAEDFVEYVATRRAATNGEEARDFIALLAPECNGPILDFLRAYRRPGNRFEKFGGCATLFRAAADLQIQSARPILREIAESPYYSSKRDAHTPVTYARSEARSALEAFPQ